MNIIKLFTILFSMQNIRTDIVRIILNAVNNKLKNIIYAEGDVKINNKKDEYLIYSDEITYYKYNFRNCYIRG